MEVYSNPQTGPLPGPPGGYLSGRSAHKFIQIKYILYLFQHTSTVECRSCVVYAQDNNSLPVWIISSQAHHHISINSQPFWVGIVSHRPELDVSRELNVADAVYYQSLIGILRWIVELGRVNVCLEVSMMSSHLALPREGHLEQILHIFTYWKKYHNTELVYDPSDPVVDENDFERRDWVSSEFGI